MSCRALIVGVALLLASAGWHPAAAGSAIGDAGHFVAQFQPRILVNNPDGLAFSVTVHRYIWPVAQFNARFRCQLAAPGGAVVDEARLPKDQGKLTLRAAAGARGVYEVRVRPSGYGLCWIECSLDQMVARCPDIGPLPERAPGYEVLMLHAMAPRRWYFYVPPNVESFHVKTAIGAWMTPREDYGVQVVSPRGQRVAALYGGLSPQAERPKGKSVIVSCAVEADPGTRGRFWSLWVTGGDSHNYSDFRIILDGVPPYVAPTPEQWFNPETGKAPQRLAYDQSQIRLPRHRAKGSKPAADEKASDYYNWAPAPYLGDEDYNGIRGKATVLLRHPEDRPLEFGDGTYLAADKAGMPIRYVLTDPAGKTVFSTKRQFIHGRDYSVQLPQPGAGVYRMLVDAATWFAWSVPAVPMLLEGRKATLGRRFSLQIAAPRHWYFKVPAGTRRFSVNAAVAHREHVLSLEVHAPDRLIQPAFVRGGKAAALQIEVPRGLDDRIWFLRLAVGSPTRFVSEDPANPTHVRIDADIALAGVPGYLAPTWGQWFETPPAD